MAKQKPQPKKSDIPTISPTPKKDISAQKKAQNGSKSSNFPAFLPILVVLAITFIAFSPTFSNEFVNYDDDLNITKNTLLQSFSWANISAIFSQNIIGAYNPLTIFTFAIEKAVFGVEKLPTAIHFDSVLLHLGCVYFVYRLAKEMGLNQWAVLLLSLLFGIHPMRVESVAWATERKDVLYAIFFFASLLQYVKYVKSNHYTFKNKYFILAATLFGIGLFAKVQMVSLPLSMLAMDYYFKRPLKWNLIFEKSVFWLGSLAMGIANVLSLTKAKTIGDNVATFSFLERLCIGAYSYITYLGKCIFPWRLSPFYPYTNVLSTEIYVAPVFFLASVALLIVAFKRDWRKITFGWLFFFFNFIFVSQIVGAGQGFLADRFTYVAYFGTFFILAALTEGYLSKSIYKFIFAAYLILCFSMTWNQSSVWKNSETLWTHSLQYYPQAALPWANRGIHFRDLGQNEKAIADLTKAIAIEPKAASFNSRGKAYFDTKRIQLALEDYNNAIARDPKIPESYANRAAAYGTLGNTDLALADVNKALEFDPENTNALVNRGTAYLALKKLDLAITDFSKILAKDANHNNARLNRMLAYKESKQFDLALIDNEYFLKSNKTDAGMWLESALLKRKLGRCSETMSDYNAALAINARMGFVYLERARCQADLGNRAAAKQDAQTAQSMGIAVDPNLLQ